MLVKRTLAEGTQQFRAAEPHPPHHRPHTVAEHLQLVGSGVEAERCSVGVGVRGCVVPVVNSCRLFFISKMYTILFWIV